VNFGVFSVGIDEEEVGFELGAEEVSEDAETLEEVFSSPSGSGWTGRVSRGAEEG